MQISYNIKLSGNGLCTFERHEIGVSDPCECFQFPEEDFGLNFS